MVQLNTSQRKVVGKMSSQGEESLQARGGKRAEGRSPVEVTSLVA